MKSIFPPAFSSAFSGHGDTLPMHGMERETGRLMMIGVDSSFGCDEMMFASVLVFVSFSCLCVLLCVGSSVGLPKCVVAGFGGGLWWRALVV